MPSPIDLLPTPLSSLLRSTSEDGSLGPLEPAALHAALARMPRSTWLRLGADCHTQGFMALDKEFQSLAARSSSSTSSSIAARPSTASSRARTQTNQDNPGVLPRIAHSILHFSPSLRKGHSAVATHGSGSVDTPLLWQLFYVYKQCYLVDTSNDSLSRTKPLTKPQGSPQSWQLYFLKSACPDVFVMAVLEYFLQYGRRRGFEYDIPRELVESIDFELCSSSGPAKLAVQAWIQTIIACRRYVKTNNISNQSIQSARRAMLLSISSLANNSTAAAANTEDHIEGSVKAAATSGSETTGDDNNDAKAPTETDSDPEEGELPEESTDSNTTDPKLEQDLVGQEMALHLSNACTALEVFFESGPGKDLPKLQALLQQELAADAKAYSKPGQGAAGSERGIKRAGAVAGIGSGTGVGSKASGGITGMDGLDAKKRIKLSGIDTPGSALAGTTIAPPLITRSQAPGTVRPNTVAPQSLASIVVTTALAKTGLTHPLIVPTVILGTENGEPGVIRSSSHFLNQALTGFLSSTSSAIHSYHHHHATSTLSISGSGNQQAKLSNPLWSPVLGLNYLPQAYSKYTPLFATEIERWMTLMGHLGGAVFSEKLVSLIKAVYPTDQKFLLDQVLVEYMCWEGTNGSERDDIEALRAVGDTMIAPFSAALLVAGEKTQGKAGEWLVETIMNALVSLVIKPEESTTYLEPGSKRWTERMEVSEETDSSGASMEGVVSTGDSNTGAGVGVGSNFGTGTGVGTGMGIGAANRAKRRRIRTMYNRRVSPFYATLAMFQPKRVATRAVGMLYFSNEEAERITKSGLKGKDAKAGVGFGGGPGGIGVGGAGGGIAGSGSLLRADAETLTAEKLTSSGNAPEVEELIQLANESNKFLKAAETEDPELMRLSSKARRRLYRQMRKLSQQQSKLGQAPGVPDPRESLRGSFMDVINQSTGGANANRPPGSTQAGTSVEKSTETTINDQSMVEASKGDSVIGSDSQSNRNTHIPPVSNSNENNSVSRGDVTNSTNAAGATEGKDSEMKEEHDSTTALKEEIEDENEDEIAIQLAKQVEVNRTVCQAPFRVLMLILQSLTRMNQTGALDAWITDALSGTVSELRVLYFEWLLSTMINSGYPSPTFTLSSMSISRSGSVSSLTAQGTAGAQQQQQQQQQQRQQQEEEILRLLGVLVVAQGIGQEPLRTALERVEAKQNKMDGKEIEIIWNKVRQLLGTS
ncbi:hypothetical protein BGW38_003100 [Lunasporangiospora selenospora]|uniref:Uncharacterized protein n=1 Tax=Lunasporangiospora selenospora TaxID=979761 RepID=A0A9P6G1D3_9FUNG|nr:hypothetical protein BGW38_003100 [Lunasporangiospora selenospora]